MPQLDVFEWHDLPLESISIGENGLLLIATPFNEETQEYGRAELRLSDAESITIDVSATLGAADLNRLEVAAFDYDLVEDRLSGTIGILPANCGYWTIEFTRATYQLTTSGI